MKPKLWFFDIDGTLNKATIATLKRSEIPWSIATGRGFLRTIEVLDKPPNIPMVLEDGGRVTRLQKDIITVPIEKETIDLVIKEIATPFINGHIDFAGFCELKGTKYHFLSNSTENLSSFSHLISSVSETIDLFKKKLNEKSCVKITIKMKKGFYLEPNSNLKWSMNEGLYNFNPHNTDKASGIIKVLNLLNIPMEDIGIAGNDFNDISMFKLPVMVKIAVGNECSELKELSTHKADIQNLQKILGLFGFKQ